MWQDTAIALCQLAFFPAMLPTILGKDKPALSTSVLNAVIVTIITVCLFTLHLWFSVATSSLIVVLWAVLALQKWSLDKQQLPT